jgi:hypothetical protein
VVFLLTEFPLRQQKSVSFTFRCALIFVDTYAHYFRSQFRFSKIKINTKAHTNTPKIKKLKLKNSQNGPKINFWQSFSY